jgi:hypothetical protein
MGVSTSEVGSTSATTGRGDHEIHKRHVVAFEENFSERGHFVRHISSEEMNKLKA